MASGNPPDTVPKPKPSGKKAGKLSQKEQSERFIEAARELQINLTDHEFDRALDLILPRPQAKDGMTG